MLRSPAAADDRRDHNVDLGQAHNFAEGSAAQAYIRSRRQARQKRWVWLGPRGHDKLWPEMCRLFGQQRPIAVARERYGRNRPAEASITCKVLRPMLPVEPRTATLLTKPSAGKGRAGSDKLAPHDRRQMA